VAVGRTGAGPITVLDGLHRMAAWAGHAEAGRGDPLVVDVVLTGQGRSSTRPLGAVIDRSPAPRLP